MIPRTFYPASEPTGPPQPDPTFLPRVLSIRAPQAATSSAFPAPSGESTEAASKTSRSAFQHEASSSNRSEDIQDSTNGTIAKGILEYVFLAIAVIIVGGIVVRRMLRLKRTNQPLNKFFNVSRDQSSTAHALPRNLPRTTGLPPVPRRGSGGYPLYDTYLAGVPAVYHPTDRRVRAFDTDAGGRRLGVVTENDHDVLSDRDDLPAYDKAGSPPQYAEALEMQTFVQTLGIGDPQARTSATRHPDTFSVAEIHPGDSPGNTTLQRDESTNLVSSPTTRSPDSTSEAPAQNMNHRNSTTL